MKFTYLSSQNHFQRALKRIDAGAVTIRLKLWYQIIFLSLRTEAVIITANSNNIAEFGIFSISANAALAEGDYITLITRSVLGSVVRGGTQPVSNFAVAAMPRLGSDAR